MELRLDDSGMTLEGQALLGAEPLRRVLGDPTRTLLIDREIPGLEERAPPFDLLVWDRAGLMGAGDDVIVVMGANELAEPAWTESVFRGRISIRGRSLDVGDFEIDPLYEDRFILALGQTSLVLFTDWRRSPFKLIVRPVP